jgi:hypothetical protein
MKPKLTTDKTAKQVGEEHLAADGREQSILSQRLCFRTLRQHVLASVRVPEAGNAAEKESPYQKPYE